MPGDKLPVVGEEFTPYTKALDTFNTNTDAAKAGVLLRVAVSKTNAVPPGDTRKDVGNVVIVALAEILMGAFVVRAGTEKARLVLKMADTL
jgi:hypothetical protein